MIITFCYDNDNKQKLLTLIDKTTQAKKGKQKMRLRKYDSDEKITVDIKELSARLSVGLGTAKQIATDAGAVIRIGRRNLYNIRLIDEYMYKMGQKWTANK